MDSAVGPLTMLFDGVAGDWSPELIAAMGLDAAKLPPVAAPTQVVGHVDASAAAATGLPAGLPVLAGMVDGVGYVAGYLAGATFGRLVDTGGYQRGFETLAVTTLVAAVLLYPSETP